MGMREGRRTRVSKSARTWTRIADKRPSDAAVATCEKATARHDQAGQASTDDGAGAALSIASRLSNSSDIVRPELLELPYTQLNLSGMLSGMSHPSRWLSGRMSVGVQKAVRQS
jgi:hypothetical protein